MRYMKHEGVYYTTNGRVVNISTQGVIITLSKHELQTALDFLGDNEEWTKHS